MRLAEVAVAGRPERGLLFRPNDLFLIPFSLIWVLCFTAFLVNGFFGKNAPAFSSFVIIPFAAAAVYMNVGRFFIDSKKRSNTVYGMTQERIIIKTGIFSQSTNSLYIKALSEISIKQRKDGSGTIMLDRPDRRTVHMQGVEWPGVQQPPMLDLIPDARSVYDKIVQLQRQ